MARKLVWFGAGGQFRVEIAHVDVEADTIRGCGTQIGLEDEPYELRYELGERFLHVELVGGRTLELELQEGHDHFDVGYSPLFNSLPVLAHGLHRGGEPRDFLMTWVSVPDLGVRESRQRYDPLGGEGIVRYISGTFEAAIVFDEDGFVVHYPGLADRFYPAQGNQLF